MIDRLFTGLAALGYAYTAYRVQAIVWPVEPLLAIAAVVGLGLLAFMLAVEAVTGAGPYDATN